MPEYEWEDGGEGKNLERESGKVQGEFRESPGKVRGESGKSPGEVWGKSGKFEKNPKISKKKIGLTTHCKADFCN